MIQGKVTVSEIAQKAGVSPATVSRVINHRELVKDSTAQKVEAAMISMGCPLILKKAHKPHAVRFIVMNIPTIGNSFYQDVIRGAHMSAIAHGYQLLVHEALIGHSSIDDYCSLLRHTNAAGTILLSPVQKELLDWISATVPLVQCCEYNEHASYPYVSIDDFAAAETATNHIISCGRKKIALVNSSLSFKYARERQKGFLSALAQADIIIPDEWIIQLSKIDFEMAFVSVCRLLNLPNRPNAFFTVSDIFAASVIRAANRFGLSVPKDIIVVGFDNIELSQMTTPSITTMKQPSFQQGYSACELVINSIEYPTLTQKPLLLRAELVERESTLSIY